MTDTMTVRDIPLDLIILPDWNSRASSVDDKSERAEIESLAVDIKRRGIQTPIEVQDLDDGRFLLTYGNRRYAASKVAGLQTIPAKITAKTSENERRIRNMVENVKRKNLTMFEEARLCAEMRNMGLKNGEIAAELGFSQPKVSNLFGVFSGMPEPIKDEWKKQNPVASFDFLRSIASDKTLDTPEKKMKAWDDAVAEAEEAKEAGKQAGKRGKAKKGDGGGSGRTPVSQKRFDHALMVLSTAKGSPDLPTDTRTWARALLVWITKGRETPPTGIPDVPQKAPKADK